MRRPDQALESTKAQVLERAAQFEAQCTSDSGMELALLRVTKQAFYNRSKLSFPQVLDDQSNVAEYLKGHIDGQSSLAREVIEKFEFERHIDRLNEANLLFQVIARIATVDLHGAFAYLVLERNPISPAGAMCTATPGIMYTQLDRFPV